MDYVVDFANLFFPFSIINQHHGLCHITSQDDNIALTIFLINVPALHT